MGIVWPDETDWTDETCSAISWDVNWSSSLNEFNGVIESELTERMALLPLIDYTLLNSSSNCICGELIWWVQLIERAQWFHLIWPNRTRSAIAPDGKWLNWLSSLNEFNDVVCCV
jgi:hypothetical protein